MGYIALLIGITVVGIMAYTGFSTYLPTVLAPQTPIHNVAINLPMERTFVSIGKNIIQVEVAGTTAQHAQGLSGRKSLPNGQGMLFAFSQPQVPGFWMKDMLFPIDIIWISAEGASASGGDTNLRVVGLSENLQPNSYPKTFSPPSPILYVLEVPTGYARSNMIKVGEVVLISDTNK